MALDRKRFGYGKTDVLRDLRPLYVRIGDAIQKPTNALALCIIGAASLFFVPSLYMLGDIIIICYLLYFWWLTKRDRSLPGKLPVGAKYVDQNNMTPGKNGEAEGIFFVGNEASTNQQIWYTNSDARTHILYLGTTGSGKTEGLKSFATNAVCWASGFVFIDGKADMDLWSSLSSLVRRLGRDDDLLVLNYMTGNADGKAPSNTMNPFSSGSASYLTQMLISLMPEAEGDNAMWKERAVSLLSSLMPALTYKRDHHDFPVSVNSIRNYLNLNYIIQLSRDELIPDKIREGLKGYLDTLPGYVDEAFDDEGKEKPMGPDQPMTDTTTVRQQHGYLTMQFTRALQSLGDDYGYIFDTQAADIDMVDVVLNRRILVVLIPALEKSGDETANLGKIIAATLRGMMGSTLGSKLEGESSTVIENRPTNAATPFVTIFDEVGYYTAQGMAVMAAQARSLGFCLVFAAQDLQAMEKRVKEEARSITANCNIKIFGKLQDPTQTREFFENHIGSDYVAKVSGLQLSGGMSTGSYADNQQVGIETGTRADYDDLKNMKEGQAIISFAMDVLDARIFYSNPGHAKAMRVSRYLALPEPDKALIKHASSITKLRDLLCDKNWTALNADVAMEPSEEITALEEGFILGEEHYDNGIDHAIIALCDLHARLFPTEAQEASRALSLKVQETEQAATQAAPEKPPTAPIDVTKTPEPTEAPQSTDHVPTKESVSWDALVNEENATETPKEETPVQKIKKKLSSDVENILKKAGQDMRDKLFKSNKDKGDIDAAE